MTDLHADLELILDITGNNAADEELQKTTAEAMLEDSELQFATIDFS